VLIQKQNALGPPNAEEPKPESGSATNGFHKYTKEKYSLHVTPYKQEDLDLDDRRERSLHELTSSNIK